MNGIKSFLHGLFSYTDFHTVWDQNGITKFDSLLFILSDLLIWAGYFIILASIFIFAIIKRKKLSHNKFVYLLIFSILLSGVTYFSDALLFWVPAYKFGAWLRFCTAIVSWASIFYGIKILPHIFELRSDEKFRAEKMQRERIERELKQKNELLQEAEKIAKLCYMQWDVLNEHVEVSDEVWKILDVEQGSRITYSGFMDMLHPDDAKQMKQMIDLIFNEKRFPDTYCRFITPKDEVKYMLIRGQLILDETGNIAMIKGTMQDVTEQRLTMQKIQLQNERLKDIAWIQSHKVRSPVATIMGLMQLFNNEQLSDPVNEKVLEGLHEAVQNLDEVIKEINSKTETMKLSA